MASNDNASTSDQSEEGTDEVCAGASDAGDEPCAPDAPADSAPSGRANYISTVLLYGVPIVALLIDGKERLCLAQISNVLLKNFSYNEIHNRRVALGINCVQCTPVQLEILRRAGAMPVSSRRCGMITRREAERLVKTFLEDVRPPKLPDNFAFNVYHQCGWGGDGQFVPSRYNSSRAKCVRCNECDIWLSPNKFIFHFHKRTDAHYQHPDAANFNSWRRHLVLRVPTSATRGEVAAIETAWEDVKAMFNGGSRKRIGQSLGGDGGASSAAAAQRAAEAVRASASPAPQAEAPWQGCKVRPAEGAATQVCAPEPPLLSPVGSVADAVLAANAWMLRLLRDNFAPAPNPLGVLTPAALAAASLWPVVDASGAAWRRRPPAALPPGAPELASPDGKRLKFSVESLIKQ